MTSKQMAQHVRLSEWAQILRARRESGQSVKEWCADNGINEKRYYYWQNKLRQATCEQVKSQEKIMTGIIPTGWAQLSADTTVERSDTVTIEIGSGRVVADRNTSAELLTTACRVLVSLC